MANYYTQFSCRFDVGSTDNAERSLAIRDALATKLEEAEGHDLGSGLELDPDRGPGALWISSGDDGEPEHVIAFALRCAEAFNLTGRWGFVWAITCSKPRLDGFGGGAQLIDLGQRRSLAWLDCEHWLAMGLASDGAQSDIDGGEQAMAQLAVLSDNSLAAVPTPPTAA